MASTQDKRLPGLNCGACGYRTCDEFEAQLATSPDLIERCIHLAEDAVSTKPSCTPQSAEACMACSCAAPAVQWQDSLGREFDFYLEHFPEDPGPREIILPHNPMITREMDIAVGEILIGRPLGMSCGCPVTHCGVVTHVERRTGVITWCVTGPLGPRSKGYKDIGYYIAEAYEGIVHDTRRPLRIGERYYFQPRMCMLQWRHSGLVNYINRTADAWQIRLEGLFIG